MALDDKKERRYYKLYDKLKMIAEAPCRFLFGIKKENEIRLPQEPCLVVVNHTCYFDPLIVALCVDQPLFFVTGENLLRHKLAAFLAVDVFRSIPCSKGKMSVGTIRDIFNSLKAGHYVNMFAEGNITYDGTTAPLTIVNGKLFKALQCTVVTVAITGAYQIIPRWSGKFCRGSIRAQLKGVYTKEMLHDMTPEKIVERFNEDLYVEQPELDSDKTYRRSAKGIHYVLYVCPTCGALGKIRGKGKEIRCLGCGKTWKYNEFGRIEEGRFETIWQWNRWQMKFVRELVHGKGAIQIATSHARLHQIVDNHKRLLLERGILLLDREKLTIGKYVFPLENIYRMDTRNKGVILFSVKNEEYYEVTAKKGFSGLMYKTFFEMLKEK